MSIRNAGRRCGIAWVAVVLLCGCRSGATVDTPPNIVVIVVDDLRWDELGVTGHPFVETPNIDRIANEGARFLNAFATTPLCSPSRGNILTGLYARASGIIDNTDRSATSHDMMTFPRQLDAAGYETAFIGKWHMGNDDTRRPGFDYWVAMPGQGEAIDPELNEDDMRHRVEGYVTDLLTDRAVSFLENATAPWSLFFAHKSLHPNIRQLDDGSTAPLSRGGFIAADRHVGRYADAEPPRRPSAFLPPAGKPALQRRIGDLPPLGRETATEDRTIIERLEMLLAVDESVGRLRETLEASGELDNTVFVVTSDHGYFYGEHGLSVERRLAYEETIRIPLFIRYPSLIEGGSTPAEFALTVDLAPTLLDLAGVESSMPLHGRSLRPVFAGETDGWRTSFMVEYFSDTVFRRIVNMGYNAVRNQRYKYIHYLELEGMDELYDLETDPYEMTNVIDSPDYASTLRDMQSELDALATALN